MKLTKKKSYPWLLVISYSLLGVCFPAAVTQFSMVVSSLTPLLDVTKQQLMLADSLRAVCLVIGMFSSSFVYRRLGLRKTMMLGIFFQISPQFLIPLAVQMKSLPLLYIFKGMQGLNSMAFPLYIATITAWVSERSRGLATAIFNGSFTAGAGVGAWISGKLIPLLGWQSSFFAIGGICLVFAVPALLLTREKEGMSIQPISKLPESKFRTIARNPMTWMLVVMLLAHTWISQAITVDMPIYSDYMSYSFQQTGRLMLIISIVTVISSILAGGISDFVANRSQDKIRARTRLLAGGYLVSAVASMLLHTLSSQSYTGLLWTGASMMIGVSWAQGIYWAIPSEIYSPADNIVATSICTGASNIVNPMAPFVVGVVLGTRDLWWIGWLTCGVMALVSALSALVFPRMVKAERKVKTKEEEYVSV